MFIRRLKQGALLLLCIVLLSSCGRRQEDTQTVTEREAYDWKNKGFVAQGAETEKLLYAVNYRKIDAGEVVSGRPYYIVISDNEFLRAVEDDNAELTVSFHSSLFELGENQDPQGFRIDMREDWGIEEPDLFQISMAQPDEIMFFVVDGVWEYESRDWAKHYYVLRTDRQGNLQSKTDLMPKLKERQIWADSSFASGLIRCDGERKLYLIDIDTYEVFLLDGEGEYLASYRYRGDNPAGMVLDWFRTDQGEILFVGGQGNGQGMECEFVMLNEAGAKVVSAMELPAVQRWYGMWGDYIYCAVSDRVTRWDVSTGEKESLYDLKANAIDTLGSVFIPNGDGGILLATGKAEEFLLRLTTEKPESTGEILVKKICTPDSNFHAREQAAQFLGACAASFSRENPLCRVVFEDSSNEEGAMTREFMEMSRGEGADILFVSWNDLQNLWENGVLGDLGQVLSEENRAALYPAVLKCGERGGQYAGLPYGVYISVLYITDEYWQEASWKAGDILRIVEENEKLEGLFLDGGLDGYRQNLRVFLGNNLMDSAYIHEGRANFDTEEFRRILRTVKDKGNVLSYGLGDEQYAAVREGRFLGNELLLNGISMYAYNQEELGGTGYPIGMPAEEGRSVPFYAEGFVAVNRNAMERPGVKEFVNYLFSFDVQVKVFGEFSTLGVRSDVLGQKVEFDEYYQEWVFRRQDGGDLMLGPAPFSFKEFDALWQDAVYANSSDAELFQIILEEANAYFQSDKNIDQVIDSITKRVQLYLDERK